MPKTPAANAININPSLTSFKPRQVLLANPKLRPNMNKSSIPALKPEQKALLLRSIAGYLKSNGFSKTLKKFLSEAEIEKDKINDSSLDLEHMCCKYLETWNYGSTNLSSQKVQDGNSKKEENADFVAGVETLSKKKKKRDNEDSHAVVMQAVDSGKLSDSNETEKQKTKEEKKNKKTSDSLIDAEQVSSKKPADSEVSDPQLHEPEKKQKDKKKKKGKLDSESLVENADLGLDGKLGTKAKESESLRESQATETTMVNGNISLEDERVKVKGKKKKKDGSVSKSSCDGDSKEIDEQKPGKNESKNDAIKASDKDATDKEKKGSKKRKRSTSEVNNSEPIDNKEVDESKRRKTEGSDKLNGSGQVTEVIGSVGTNGHTEKEIKGESDQVNIVKNGEKSALNKSAKKQGNVSAGPTTAKAFQRVKVEEVVFIDERLKDNSYWAKDGAEIGYGAKAQEVLGQVRGRDFRHEKTKKKRGSYRGGQIGLQSHSIKFNYSDEE